MKTLLWSACVLVAGGCVQVSDRSPDSVAAKIDTSSGMLATAPPVVDSTPTSTTPGTPPLIGPDSTTRILPMSPAEMAAALRTDTAVALIAPVPAPVAPVAGPAAAPVPAPTVPVIASGTDLDGLRRAGMQVPVSGITPAMLRDTYDEMRGGTRRHDAIDIPAPRGTPVVAATGGRVLKLFNSKAGGLMVYATDSSERFIMMYGHLDAYQPGLAAGHPLRRGQVIGTVGITGNAPPTVPHLHFAVARSANVRDWWKGTPVNPYPLLRP